MICPIPKVPLCRDWEHRERMRLDIISSVTLLPNISLRGYQWFQGLWNLTIRNLQASSCAKLYRCFSIFLCNPEHSCAESHNYKQLKELVNKDSYRAFTAWVMAKALLHYPFRAKDDISKLDWACMKVGNCSRLD